MKNSVWYPYQQMQLNSTKYKVIHAEKEFLYLDDKTKLIDGISSWWASIHGYNHPELNKALINQVEKFSHIMLGGLTHDPVQQLAEKLIEITPKDLKHVFFSDSGSVAVEVALKMAIQYWSNLNKKEKNKFISLKDAYHGDTFKTMEVGDDSDYQNSFNHILNKGYYVSTPKDEMKASDSSIQLALNELEDLLKIQHNNIAAFIVEPIIQGAAGFQLYSPIYLEKAFKLCKKYRVLFICDEVATGFGRTGKLFASEHAEISPDIMVIGKALTAGYLGHAATLASTEIFNAFLGNEYDKAFMHGPTFMGNPLACAVALKGIEIFENENYIEKISNIEKIFIEKLSILKHKNIKKIRVLGGMAVIEVNDSKALDGVQEFAYKNGVWLRPFGNFLYSTPPYIINHSSLNTIISTIINWFEVGYNK